jgi:hypothetical protein
MNRILGFFCAFVDKDTITDNKAKEITNAFLSAGF